MAFKVAFKVNGPLFGSPSNEVKKFLVMAKEEIAKQGVNRIKQRLGQVLENPTGRYESHVRTERQRNDFMITDLPVVYGPWLEGTGSRNAASRFKGYRTFRIIRQELDSEVIKITRSEVEQLVKRLNE